MFIGIGIKLYTAWMLTFCSGEVGYIMKAMFKGRKDFNFGIDFSLTFVRERRMGHRGRVVLVMNLD